MAQYTLDRLRCEYASLWADMRVTKLDEARQQALRIIKAKARYQAVEDRTGVPWFVIGCLHMRESNASFTTWLHNGDPMKVKGVPRRTVNVPAGRPINPDCSWEDGAYDALVVCEHLDQIKVWGPEPVAYAMEKFNGFGYRSPERNIPSPYLWGGTSIQKPGKFVRDRVYDPNVMDTQIGGMAVLKTVMELDKTARFERLSEPPPAPKPSVPDLPPLSPRADDGEAEVKPITKSKTMWGGIMQWLAGAAASFAAIFQWIATPWGFAALALIVVALSVGLYLVIKGRIDVQKIIKHLSQDDT